MAMASSALPLIDSVLFEYEGDEDEFSSDGGDACNAKYDDDDGNDDGNSGGMKKSGKEQKSLTSNHLESDTVVQPARFIIFNLPPPSQPRGGTRSSVSLPCSSTSSPRRNKVMIVKASDYKWTSQMGRSRSMTKSFLYRQHSQEIAPLSFQNKDDRITESNSSDHWSSSDPLPDDLNNSSTICGVPLDTEIKPEISSEPHFQRNTGINPDNSVQNNRRPTKYCCVPCRTKIRQDSSDHNFSTTCCITRGDKTQHDKRSTNKCGIQFLRGRKFKSDDDRRSNKCCIPRSTRVKPTDSSDDACFSNNGGVKFPCGKDTENDRSDRSGEDNHHSSRCCIKIKPDKSSSDVVNRRSPKCCVPCGGKSKSDSGNNNNRFKYGSLCTFLPGLSKWKKHHHVPSTPRRAGTNRTGIITPVRSDTVSRITSLKKFECGSSSSSVMPSDMAEEEEGPEEGGDSYYELPIEMITDDQVNDTTSPVKAAFFIDQSKDRKGVLKLNDSKSMSTKASISRHVRFLTSPQPSRPCSPTNHEEKNGRLLGWPRRN
ncbi:hypothetical protein ZOSMA_28G00400 [Zostera marina]|uniref:Uncharacterized protein n=1 Tax=Zostera marina TaxID=29655 RepID=A0A0K9PCA4_ZOSMR|nr:hypothetical protein ZOSMA_28G00400 [Zostera marina]